MNTSQTWPSPAKLNLFLHITGQLDNGYHSLQTTFQFLDYGDELTFIANNDSKISIYPGVEGINDEDNLIYRAAMLLKPFASINAGVDITLHKVLPMGAGLGGGSSNAATTLVALNHLWQINLSTAKLASLGLSLGADVPIFVHGFAAFAEGVGEKLTPVEPEEPWYLIIWPGVHVNTGEIFSLPELPRNTPTLTLEQLSSASLGNDCEQVTKNRHPEVAKALDWLIEYAPAKMTGTGSCVFGQFETQQAAEAALQKLPKDMHGFVAKGINQSPLATKLAQLTSHH
ncbi:4-(cytidine 5'-diphospho)-2-C-methyl-D-erythritol kinase [Psychrobium sp. 1_MG-2023]|uniref:4-(cytidine 5'-diphospho)-2-C-methyl-D-erythritol kinase n=1 Tax=Psychrobium sp. 1_MG-2023 TaxID=3062624 RepID=UPI000C3404D5|nr:4-(cytidine 5'-diphospho)-2-C-methyl-D-erythritol kinase [Psychrobium sp. 1_MG-2023]MDP2560945.1 4-(cytidine 5'-diphospho)-2-C-methyl-D-erythritol kinase [Psychrobium sp. 1_MG-2023]PKF56017.1 4-(cytidine 5'-diphospho)-2-C-methyl-D-erythritol kinase [Alteromonadales bacterium alter-6D02]